MDNTTSIEFKITNQLLTMIYKANNINTVLMSKYVKPNSSYQTVITEALKSTNIENIKG